MSDGTPLPRAARAAVLLALAALAVLAPVALHTRSGLRFLKYPVAAEHLLAGTLAPERLVDFSPLYLWLNVLAVRFLPEPAVALLGLQTLLAALAVGLLYVVLRRRVSGRLALLGCAGLLLNRNLLVHQSILEPEVLLLFLLMLVLVLIARPGGGSTFAAGIAGALALATRPSLLPVLAFVPVVFALGPPANVGSRTAHRRLGVRCAIFLLPLVLAVAATMVRSARATGDPLAPGMNPGTVFFEGNNPLSFGTSAVYPPVVAWLAQQPSSGSQPDYAHQIYRDIARASTGRQLSVREVNAYWQGRALAFMRDEPLRWLRLELGKLTLALHNVRLHDVATAWLIERELGLLPTLPFALVGALALVGLLIEASRWRTSLIFYVLFSSQLLVMLVFYVSARQRIALLPAACYFAVVALERLARPRRGWYLALVALLALCLVLPHPQLAELDYQRRHAFEAEAIASELRPAFAKDPPAWHLERAVALLAARPGVVDRQRPAYLPQEEQGIDARVLAAVEARGETSPSARFDHALASLAAGRPEAAEAELAALEAGGFTPYRLAMPITLATYRAQVARARGRGCDARAFLRQALEKAPGDPFALAERLVASGDPEDRRRLYAYWSRVDAEILLGRAWLAHGDARAALEHLRWAAAAAPALRSVQIDLAVALAGAGQRDEGVRHFLAEQAKSVDPIAHDPEVPKMFRAWLAEAPEPRRRLVTAQVLYAYGYLREALALLAPLEQQAAGRLGPRRANGATHPYDRDVLRQTRDLRRALAGSR